MAKKNNKCLICRKKKDSTSLDIKEWIIDGKNDAIAGKTLVIHSKCLSNKLYVERPDGFVYGRITLGKDEVKDG